MSSNFFFRKSFAYEMWKTIVLTTDASIIWRMFFACCIYTSTNTHSQHVILIAIPL